MMTCECLLYIYLIYNCQQVIWWQRYLLKWKIYVILEDWNLDNENFKRSVFALIPDDRIFCSLFVQCQWKVLKFAYTNYLHRGAWWLAKEASPRVATGNEITTKSRYCALRIGPTVGPGRPDSRFPARIGAAVEKLHYSPPGNKK